MLYKIDMHCHTSEGSLDGMVDVKDIIDGLKSQGFSGVLITDHNSYDGYEEAVKYETENFKVFKGIEYDTFDCGHILIILPDGASSSIFTFFGMPFKKVAFEVHKRGGILGLAHPFDHGALGAFRRRRNQRREKEIMGYVDFVEGFNSSACEAGNLKAQEIAKKYNKPITCGSDCHKKRSIGLAYTSIKADDLSQNTLISSIRENQIVDFKGKYLQKHFVKAKHIWFNFATTVYCFAGHARLKLSRS